MNRHRLEMGLIIPSGFEEIFIVTMPFLHFIEFRQVDRGEIFGRNWRGFLAAHASRKKRKYKIECESRVQWAGVVGEERAGGRSERTSWPRGLARRGALW